MPNKHFYVAFGVSQAALTILAIRLTRKRLYEHFAWFRALYSWRRDWFLYFPLAFVPFGLWGLVPDALHALNILPKEVTRGAWFNLFYFHSWFEWLEDAEPQMDWVLNSVASIALWIIALGGHVFYWREYERASRRHRAAMLKGIGR